MSERVDVRPELLRWAIARSGKDLADYIGRFPSLEAWLRKDVSPTLEQLESFAEATHTPIGYLFLPSPPEERVPIPDFRRRAHREARPPSSDLLETIYLCQQRQEWSRDFARAHGESPLRIVGAARVGDDVVTTASAMREQLGFGLAAQRQASTWTDALRAFIEHADAAGIMVMCSSVALNNDRRTLDPEEFRGFALVDPLAPVVFINGADIQAAQMFTLAHELAHIWVGETAISGADVARPASHEVEKWCNRVAAELLVPLAEFRAEYVRSRPLADEIVRLARVFQVSTLVILRRAHDVGGLTWEHLGVEYDREVARLAVMPRGGDNLYVTQEVRVSQRFARALVVSTHEGETLYRDAFRLLGVSKVQTFQRFGHSLGGV